MWGSHENAVFTGMGNFFRKYGLYLYQNLGHNTSVHEDVTSCMMTLKDGFDLENTLHTSLERGDVTEMQSLQ